MIKSNCCGPFQCGCRDCVAGYRTKCTFTEIRRLLVEGYSFERIKQQFAGVFAKTTLYAYVGLVRNSPSCLIDLICEGKLSYARAMQMRSHFRIGLQVVNARFPSREEEEKFTAAWLDHFSNEEYQWWVFMRERDHILDGKLPSTLRAVSPASVPSSAYDKIREELLKLSDEEFSRLAQERAEQKREKKEREILNYISGCSDEELKQLKKLVYQRR